MTSLLDTPLEQMLASWWRAIDVPARNAFFAALVINVLAFGFEMTNLTLHHDDVIQIYITDTILGHYLGRFGIGWLHYYTQNHYFAPFLQMAEGIVLMSWYGVAVARFWGERATLDIAIVAAILCVFPYMAQTYQYNTSMAPYPLAHLLVAYAVILSARATLRNVAIAALLYVGAFSIYQAVAANAATIFLVWLLCRLVYGDTVTQFASRDTVRAAIAVVGAAIIGGVLYLAAVSQMHIEYDSYQAAEGAFRLEDATAWPQAVREIWQGTRSFFVWPEHYYPDYLKWIQLAFVAAAGVCSLWLARPVWAKFGAVGLLALIGLSPRLLQLLHPAGHYHSLTLTGYAVSIAAWVMIAVRARPIVLRNIALVGAFVLVGGYLLQCNWISTVNYLNTVAHFDTMTQVLARVRSIPGDWDGRKVVVVGRYEMPNEYPFTTTDAVAPKFLDGKHMAFMAHLLRDDAEIVEADQTMPHVLEYARSHAPWPAPGSVAIVDGAAVVVFAKPSASHP